MRLRRDNPSQIKTPAELAVMREAGLVTAAALGAAAAAVEPGITTAELDASCVSVNQQIVHGIPSQRQVLRAGDLVSLDCGAIVGGWHGDSALTVVVSSAAHDGAQPRPGGPSSAQAAGLVAACEQALWRGLAAAEPGRRLSDISAAIEQSATAAGPYGIVRGYTGHGIGTRMHMDPAVPNHGRPGRGPVLREGMALAIEPMLVLGDPGTRQLADGWTVVTADGSWAAHFEHTVAITADGPWVLTAVDGGAGRLDAGQAAVLVGEGRADHGV
jgi:methionyl aminopeptidase